MDFRMKNCSDNRRNKRKRNDEDKVKESPKSDFAALSFLKDAKNRLHVSRPREVVDARNDVPIVMMEQEIMEAINENPTVIIRGKAGRGKTTQVPQLALVQRDVLLEVVLSVLLNPAALQSLRLLSMWRMSLVYNWGDFLLKRYSVIILDEVHERSLNIEILIGMLSAIIGIRQKLYEDQQKKLHLGKSIVPEKRIFPLKLLLMSATMPVEDFRKLFRDPPQVINVLSRQFKVNTLFSATTEGHAKKSWKFTRRCHMGEYLSLSLGIGK